MEVIYSDGGKFAYFDGIKYTRDDRTGYYLNGTMHERLHRAVYAFHCGNIPNGYDIHHVDHDKSNNDISNLEMLTTKEHKARHSEEITEEIRQKLRNNLAVNARPKASEWHKSAEGRKWHQQHGFKFIEQCHVCEQCGKPYKTFNTGILSKFCSNACRSAYRRKIGVDDITKICEACGNVFRTNKYSKARACSQKCGAALRKNIRDSVASR